MRDALHDILYVLRRIGCRRGRSQAKIDGNPETLTPRRLVLAVENRVDQRLRIPARSGPLANGEAVRSKTLFDESALVFHTWTGFI